MHRDDLNDLHAFAAIAAERNFTRAAARLGISQSALSHALRRLETGSGSGFSPARPATSP
jgi:DNA-binding transcriptional LysR family regulator